MEASRAGWVEEAVREVLPCSEERGEEVMRWRKEFCGTNKKKNIYIYVYAYVHFSPITQT